MSYLISLIVLCFCLGMYAYLHRPSVRQKEGVIYYVRPGISKRNLFQELSQKGILPYPTLLSIYTFTQKSAKLKSGEYFFPQGSTPLSIWKQITHGKGLFYRSLTIVPGWSFKQVRNELAKAKGLRAVGTLLSDDQIMLRLGAEITSPEGQFFPETYSYTYGVPDLVILKRSFDLMRKKLQDAWERRAPGLPYRNAYEALIAASLIEKEAYLSFERPIIAGVLVNRLNLNMLLQFDPSVIYGLGDRYQGKIHKKDLLEDTAYNTYLHKGLPPTPIAMPSMISLEAALHPQHNDYLYFVAKGNGGHHFSRTLNEHNTAVNEIGKMQSSYFNEDLIQIYMKLILRDQVS